MLASFVVFLVGAGSCLAQPVSDEPEDAVFGTGWGMTLALDGSGFYNDLVTYVLTQIPDSKPYLALPYKRAKVEFDARDRSCLYPGNIDHLKRGNDILDVAGYIETMPMVLVESHIFSQPGQAPLERLEQLAGKMVAFPNGSALPNVLAQYGATFVPTTDETTKARMLLAGRVDHMSGSLPDNIFVFDVMGESLPPYNPTLALIKVGVGIVCHRTAENIAFVGAVNGVLANRHHRQALEALFEAQGVTPRFLPAVGGGQSGDQAKP